MSSGNADPRRALPPLDDLLSRERVREWIEQWGREPVKLALRATLSEQRERLGAVDPARSADGVDVDGLLDDAVRRLENSERPSLERVLNGTGVVLHTNLGRAPLARRARDAVLGATRGYTNLEYDLPSGERGGRGAACRELLCAVTGAADAMIVNNNAAAVALAVNEFARGRDVVVSRGELVEIGGSFRIPAVVERSGARLRGVGTTNRTRISDFREAAGDGTGLLLKVHPSNYRVEGFTGEVSVEALVGLGRELGVPVLHDLGSGLVDRNAWPDAHDEPVPADSIAAGADLVTWSGDKLLGGPQAGIVVGTDSAVSQLRRSPLARAYRVGKMTLAALEATLRLHRDPDLAASRIPAIRALRESAASVRRRAESQAVSGDRVDGARIEVRAMHSVAGGGTFPTHRIPSWGWAVQGPDAEAVSRRCRTARPPLVGRVADGAFLVDVRTLLPGEEPRAMAALLAAVRAVAGVAG